MKLTAQLKLLPTPDQAELLRRTLEQANAACNAISAYAWERQMFGKYPLHKAIYSDIRQTFGLSAQVTIRCLAKVADSYRKDRETRRRFKSLGGIAYDSRILSFRIENRETAHVLIWTVGCRQMIPFVCGDRQWELLQCQQSETDLVYRKGQFYLYTTCEVQEAPPQSYEDILGIDLGVRNIAVDSDGEVYTAKANCHINTIRHRHRRLRRKLQKKGTKAARRKLKELSGKERRFAQDVNHCISKCIVARAQGTGRAVALEDLGGIRDRVTVSRSRRATLHSWSFHDLRQKIEYKAKRAGVTVIPVDPRNTSRTCPACGHVDRRNRPDQATFLCVDCGFAGFADHIAAVNISRRAAVNRPDVSDTRSAA